MTRQSGSTARGTLLAALVVLVGLVMAAACTKRNQEDVAPDAAAPDPAPARAAESPLRAEFQEEEPPPSEAKLSCVLLDGRIGASPEWYSGWLDLSSNTDFLKGDIVRIVIGGDARKVLVRLLPKGASPDSESGLLTGAKDVPESRLVEASLAVDRISVVQISVHGGPNPWGSHFLGSDNGRATISSVELCRPS